MKPAIATVVTLGLLWVSVSGSSQQAVEIEVESPRPLADAIHQLEERLGAVITYEDPVLSYDGDLETIDLNGRPFRGPRGGLFRLRLPTPSAALPDGHVERTVRLALADYSASGLAGTFRLARTGDMLHVIPSAAKDMSGASRAQTPVLDDRVSFDDAPRTAMELLDALQPASRGRLLIGRTDPRFMLQNTKLLGGANNEPMRDVLAKTLQSTSPAISWRLFCGASPGRDQCYLNVHVVRALLPTIEVID